MKSTKISDGKLYQSTLRRHAALKALIEELALRDMNHFAVAAFLSCSCSAARSYMKELMAAGLVKLPQRGSQRLVLDRANYTIITDTEAIDSYLQRQNGGDEFAPDRPGGFNGLLEGRRVHIVADDGRAPITISTLRPRRDPLVAALFGSGARE